MEKIQPSEKDVVSFEDIKPLGLSQTNKFSAVQEKLEDVLRRYGSSGSEDLLKLGIKCEVLHLGSQEWKKGRLRIQVEFIPEEITESSMLDEFRTDQ
jgi:KGK domain